MAEVGQIVWAEVPDKNGFVKERPIVVVSVERNSLVGCCITTWHVEPKPANYFRMPWDAQGHSSAGLRKPCWAVIDWLVEIHDNQIKRVSGRLQEHRRVSLVELIA